ncbi:MAG: MFS transporter [Gammaproteobacteria bacterium]
MSPSPHYRWYIVALTLVNQALALGVLVYSFALFVVPWLDEFEVSRSKVMLAILSFQIVTGLLSPVLGRYMDQFAMRLLVLSGALAMSLGLFLLSLATEFWQIVALHVTLLPVGMILTGTLASQTMVSKWFTEKRGLAIGVSSMGTSLGGLSLPLLTAWLIGEQGWQGAYLVLAMLSLILLVPLNYLVLRHDPPILRLQASETSGVEMKTWTTRQILESWAFWIPVLALIPINAAFGGTQFNLGAYMSDLGFGQAVAAQLIAVTSGAMIVGKLFFGSLGDRVDHRKLYWLMAGMLLVSMYFYEGSPGRPALFLAASLQGFATGGVMPMMGIMYSSRFGTLSFGRVLGLVNLFLMIGSFGSILSGWIFDLTQSYDAAFQVFALLLLPGTIVMYFLPAKATNH